MPQNIDPNHRSRGSDGDTFIDGEVLSNDQCVEIYAGNNIWIHDNGTAQDIKLDAKAATKLYDFLLLHMDRIHRAAKARKETT